MKVLLKIVKKLIKKLLKNFLSPVSIKGDGRSTKWIGFQKSQRDFGIKN